jgi:hypothetical protein
MMTRTEKDNTMKQLLEKEGEDSPRFFRDNDLVDYRTCSYYVYTDRYGDYIGNDVDTDDTELVDKMIEDQDFDEFMEAFLEEFIDEEEKEKFAEEGLTNEEIAVRLLDEYYQ